jgi:hypothetical protein
LGQTGPSWLSASQSFLCGELHQGGQVVLIWSPSSHARSLSPFVEVLQSRPLPGASILRWAHLRTLRLIRRDSWRLAAP